MNYSCVSTGAAGTGNITENPLLFDYQGGDFRLLEGSPCIDAGDPASPYDPDNTIADMGALYYQPYTMVELAVYLTPAGPPIQIPANGGSFDFNIAVENLETTAQVCDIWTMITLPNGNQNGPILNVSDVTLNGSSLIDRDRIQNIPAGAPAGSYTYDAYIGYYPSLVIGEDHFDFEKLTTADGSVLVTTWECFGESFEKPELSEQIVAADHILFSVYPNPFNPETNFNFNIAAAGYVNLTVYDVQGRVAAGIIDGWHSPGNYTLKFDGRNLASGIYFAKLQTGEFSKTQKLMLIK